MWKHPLLVRVSNFFVTAKWTGQASNGPVTAEVSKLRQQSPVSASGLSFLPDVFFCVSGLNPEGAATQHKTASVLCELCFVPGKMQVCFPPVRVGISKSYTDAPVTGHRSWGSHATSEKHLGCCIPCRADLLRECSCHVLFFFE